MYPEASPVLVIDSDVPWIPTVSRPGPEARIYHIDVDPLKERMPLWSIPARGVIEYQYMILPAKFAGDKWVERVEVRPSNRAAVHHAVVYIREPGSKWPVWRERSRTRTAVAGSTCDYQCRL